jgi:hypothetical protein
VERDEQSPARNEREQFIVSDMMAHVKVEQLTNALLAACHGNSAAICIAGLSYTLADIISRLGKKDQEDLLCSLPSTIADSVALLNKLQGG